MINEWTDRHIEKLEREYVPDALEKRWLDSARDNVKKANADHIEMNSWSPEQFEERRLLYAKNKKYDCLL